jgi:hypothetical protein
MRAVQRALVFFGCSACASLQPPRAVVSVHTPGAAQPNVVLATPTECASSEPALCEPATYYKSSPSNVPQDLKSFAEAIDPVMRLKLELAGYTLADARTLRLTTVERTERTNESSIPGRPQPDSTSTTLEAGLTVASLSPADRDAAARALGLGGVLGSTLTITRVSAGEIRFDLAVELRALSDGRPQWTVRCGQAAENPYVIAELMATCIGDGVLAWRAPDAVIGRAQ